MFGFRYLSPEHLKGFDNYKYRSVDTSPLAKYVMQPWWSAVVEVIPRWVAPNVLTFSGWLLVVINFALFTFYDYDFHTTSNDLGLTRNPIPSWVWLFSGVGQFISHTLDGADGKQARRTKSSTPLGELFDHGLDSWACILLPLTLFSAIGTGTKYGGHTDEMIVPCIAVVATFYLTHWEKYITGVLYLPWLYDVSQLGCSLGYILTGLYGVELWQFYVYDNISCARVLKWVLIGSFFASLPATLWNIYDHYAAIRRSSNKQQERHDGRNLSFWEAMAPGVPLALLSTCYYLWCVISPNDILIAQPRVFLFSMGIVFSNIACRLIISQMTGHTCDLFNIMLLPVMVSMALGVLYPYYEIRILFLCCFLLLVMHLHYGISVVRELCEHFDIYCFSLKKQQS